MAEKRASSGQRVVKKVSSDSMPSNGQKVDKENNKVAASSDSIKNAVKDKDDETKYRAAAMMAQNNLTGRDDVDDKVMKEEIDKIYSEMTGGKSGREMRGENLFTDTIGGLNDLINGATLTVGNGLDAVWDWGAGGIADMFGAGDIVRNAFDGEDVQGIVDIGADLGLMALGPVGWGAMVGKNVIQNSDNLTEFFSGRDNVTLEELEGDERLGKGGEAALGIGLSMLPGAGKVGNLVRKGGGKVGKSVADDAMKKNAKQIRKEERYFGKGNSKTPEMQGPMPDGKSKTKALEGVKDRLKSMRDGVTEAPGNVRDAASMIGRQGTPLTKAGRDAGALGRKAAREDAKRSIPGYRQNLAVDDIAALRSAEGRADRLEHLMKKAGDDPVKKQKALEKSFEPRFRDKAASIAGSAAASGGAAVLPYATQDDFEIEELAPYLMLSMLTPKLGKHGVGVTGKKSPTAQRAGLLGSGMVRQANREDERDVGGVLSEDDILRALKIR